MAKVHLEDGSVVDIQDRPGGHVAWQLFVEGKFKDGGLAGTVDDAIVMAKGGRPTETDQAITQVSFHMPIVAKALRAILKEVRALKEALTQ